MNIADKIDYALLCEGAALKLWGDPTQSSAKELRWGTHGSRSLNRETGRWYDHEVNEGGSTIELLARERGCDFTEATAWLRKEGFLANGHVRPQIDGKPASLGAITATYDYTDESGALLFQVVRFEPKTFRQRRPDGLGGWTWSVKGTRAVLYRLPELIEAVAQGNPVFVCEGEKDADNLARLGIPATTNAMGVGKWRSEYNDTLRGADVVIIPDNDEAGRDHAKQVAAALAGIATQIRVLNIAKTWPECPPKGDISDWIASGGTAEALWAVVDTAPIWTAGTGIPVTARPRLHPVDLSDFCSLNIKPREMVLGPIIPEKGLVMCYAARGTGKTHVALGAGFAVATGGKFLKWSAPKPRKVLLIDGEMPGAALQERLRAITETTENKPAKGMFHIIAGDLEEFGIGNLSDPKIQHQLDRHLEGVELLILDNLSSLTAVIRDNDAESWNPIQSWLLRLRRRGISVLIVHHAGKGGEQRGTSRREDVLDTSISLRRPGDYRTEEGARFEVHIEKGRGIHGADAKPFEARLMTTSTSMVWTMREIEDVNKVRVAKMLEDGLSVRDIADETGIARSTIGDLKKKIEAEKAGASMGRNYAEN